MSDPYAAIGALYDAEYADADADIAGFARRGVAGPLLVLGCGTGRVCRGLEGVRPVVGLDRSAPMLTRARAHPRAGATRYVAGELVDFSVGAFAEIVAPNGAFNFLHTRREQLACLRSAWRALPDGGPLTLDLPMPDFALLGRAHSPETLAWEGWVEGDAVRRTREVFRDPVRARLRLVDRYYRGDTLLHVSELDLRLVFPTEIEWMVECAGFYVDALHGDHRGGPLGPGCDRLIVRAIRASA